MARYWIDASLVNTAKAHATWENATTQETLYYSSQGRYYLARPSTSSDHRPRVAWLTATQAAAWLVRCGVVLPEELAAGQDERDV
jgi:hypothetical protein